MPKDLLIHIGTHKTGTTAFQAFLRDNALPLRSFDVYVPQSGTTGSRKGHHNLAWELRSDERFNPDRGTTNDLIKELQSCRLNRAVVSSEDFEYLVQYPDAVRRFHVSLQQVGWDPKYVVLFRRPDRYAVSLYRTLRRKKNGLECSFGYFACKILLDGSFCMKKDWRFYFDYPQFIRNWPFPVSALSYEDAKNRKGGISLTILRQLGKLDPSKISSTETEMNKSEMSSMSAYQRAIAWIIRARFGDFNLG